MEPADKPSPVIDPDSVIQEKAELDEKLVTLRDFIASDAFASVSPEQQHLLNVQAGFMFQYSELLATRIAAF